jgi:hypothetical protein
MRWQIQGADRQTGEDRRVEVEAESETDAVKAAGVAGLFVSDVKPLARTLDYRSIGAVDRTIPIAAGPALLPGETCFYRDSTGLVTDARFLLLGKTYAMANVTSVHVRTVKPDNGAQIVLGFTFLALGVLVLIAAARDSATGVFSPTGLIAICSIAGAVALFVAASRVKPTYALVVVSSAGETDVLRSQDRDYVDMFLSALNQAIVARR